MTWQSLSIKRIINPRSLSKVTSYDVGAHYLFIRPYRSAWGTKGAYANVYQHSLQWSVLSALSASYATWN